MSGLNLGLAAADAYYKADDARVLREQQRERFGWDKQRAEADLSTLPDRTEAARSGYQLQSAQNKANLEIVPNQAAVAKALSEFSVEELPSRIAQMRQQRIFSDVDAQTAGVAKLADLIQMGDPQQITSYLNAWRKTNPTNMKADVAQVGFTKDEKGENVFVALDAQGNPVMQMSATQIQRIRDSIGKMDIKVAKQGESIVGIKNGVATPLYTAPVDPSLAKLKMGPLERDVNYLMTSHGKTQDEALSYLNSAKAKPKETFVQEMIKEGTRLNGKVPSSSEIKSYGDMWENVRAQTSGSGQKQSNTSPAPTLDPRVHSLIGIPSP